MNDLRQAVEKIFNQKIAEIYKKSKPEEVLSILQKIEELYALKLRIENPEKDEAEKKALSKLPPNHIQDSLKKMTPLAAQQLADYLFYKSKEILLDSGEFAPKDLKRDDIEAISYEAADYLRTKINHEIVKLTYFPEILNIEKPAHELTFKIFGQASTTIKFANQMANSLGSYSGSHSELIKEHFYSGMEKIHCSIDVNTKFNFQIVITPHYTKAYGRGYDVAMVLIDLTEYGWQNALQERYAAACKDQTGAEKRIMVVATNADDIYHQCVNREELEEAVKKLGIDHKVLYTNQKYNNGADIALLTAIGIVVKSIAKPAIKKDKSKEPEPAKIEVKKEQKKEVRTSTSNLSRSLSTIFKKSTATKRSSTFVSNSYSIETVSSNSSEIDELIPKFMAAQSGKPIDNKNDMILAVTFTVIFYEQIQDTLIQANKLIGMHTEMLNSKIMQICSFFEKRLANKLPNYKKHIENNKWQAYFELEDKASRKATREKIITEILYIYKALLRDIIGILPKENVTTFKEQLISIIKKIEETKNINNFWGNLVSYVTGRTNVVSKSLPNDYLKIAERLSCANDLSLIPEKGINQYYGQFKKEVEEKFSDFSFAKVQNSQLEPK